MKAIIIRTTQLSIYYVNLSDCKLATINLIWKHSKIHSISLFIQIVAD